MFFLAYYLFVLLTSVMDKHTQLYQKLSAIAILDQESLFSNTKWGRKYLKKC